MGTKSSILEIMQLATQARWLTLVLFAAPAGKLQPVVTHTNPNDVSQATSYRTAVDGWDAGGMIEERTRRTV
jgi:hypothetical protein